MIRSSKAIPLVLIGTVTAMAGVEAVTPRDQDWNDEDFAPTTQPSGSHGSNYFHHSSYWYGSSGRGSGYGFHSGTSRGGFGHSGHAAGS